jgi:hypothetical protein
VRRKHPRTPRASWAFTLTIVCYWQGCVGDILWRKQSTGVAYEA